MACVPPPFARAVLAEASRIAPNRRTSSDGICADARHYASGGDHVPDGRGVPHAVDISQSMPGTPFWEDRYGELDVMAQAKLIATRRDLRVKYLVANFGDADMIWNPSVSSEWRQNGGYKTEHRSHLHVSFTVAAEQSTAPFFGAAPTPELIPDDEEDNMIFLAPDQKPSSTPKYVNVALAKKKVYLHGARVKQGKPGDNSLEIPSPSDLLGATATADGFVVINKDSQPYWYHWA